MKYPKACLTVCLISLASLAPSAVLAQKAATATTDKEVKTSEVTIKDLVLKVPENWTKEKSTSSMRLATYSTPTVGDDKERGELTIFSFRGGGGEVGANLERWVQQFDGKGRTAKMVKGKAGDNVYYLADISGTFNKSVGPPIMRKTEARPGYRMLGVILVLEGKGVYYLKLAGPDASIKAQAKAFRNSFGGKADSEEDFGA